MKSENTVLVLMSTYNGERYLRPQLESIYAQEKVNVKLLVRDDGSTDGTHRLLDEEQQAGRLTWYAGENLKPARSFLQLIADAPEADFYAFADQDDVWSADKLQAAMQRLGEHKGDVPALYFCQTQLVDKALRPLPNVEINPFLTYGEALMTQFVVGCTVVFNAALRRELSAYTPDYLRMHDMWVYDVCLALGGKVYFDPVPRIKYRQHGGNAVGLSTAACFRWAERVKRLQRVEHIRQRTAAELLRGYGTRMLPENRSLTERVANYRRSMKNRISLLCGSELRCFNHSVYRNGKLALLLNLF